MGPPLVGVGQGVGPLQKKAPFFVRAPPPGPLRRGVVPLISYPPSSRGFFSPPWARTWDHEFRYSFEVVPTTNCASSLVGSGNYLEWVSKLMVPGSSPRRLKKPPGARGIACEWDHPSSEWARGWGPYIQPL